MKKKIQYNKGFSLIELLIAMTIFSVISVMLVSFMSSTSAAYRKTQQNVQVQTEALQIQEQMSDIIMQAKYIRVETGDDHEIYLLSADSEKKGAEARVFEKITDKNPSTLYVRKPGISDEENDENVAKVNYAFEMYEQASTSSDGFSYVPDNYANYLNTGSEERKVIIDYKTFQLVNNYGEAYPMVGDKDPAIASDATNPIHSFQLLKPVSDWPTCYIKPKYIYTEYDSVSASGNPILAHVIYCIDDKNIYMYRYDDDESTDGYTYAKGKVDSLVTDGKAKGRLTNMVDDFYLSADAAGNSLITNIMFKNHGYQYNARNAINFRNSNVLTVRPQKMYKKVNHGTLPSETDSPAEAPETPETLEPTEG